jgi:voltage-gated potassium channel
MKPSKTEKPLSFRQRLFIIIFEADTRSGRFFDQLLILAILVSLMVIMLDSVEEVAK